MISDSARASLYLITIIPSIIASIINLYYLLCDRTLRTAFNNHVIILVLLFVLIFDSTTVIWSIHFYRSGIVLVSNPAFCMIGTFIDSTVTVIITYLMAWASIERHILIFHSHWFATKSKRFVFHYFPLFLCLIYPIIIYSFMLFIRPCTIQFDYHQSQCGFYGCVTLNTNLAIFDVLAHNFIPITIVFTLNIALFIRVLYHRHRVQQRIDWRNYKKMAIQLLLIAAVFILFLFPPIILYTAYSFGLSWNVGADYISDGVYFGFYAFMLIPFASLSSLPKLRKKCKNIIFFWQRHPTINPEAMLLTRIKPNQTINKY
ncbi:unnamed protein product [Adineta ricciae]|uniref:G-protein coupled receptors family 1 profile domain-containing protein n=1 Tax=Adineta ricciae TaxID=249248 RepID=A0A814QY28_ADIRI|nr:unnamed protein product [Adineta ricciae]CAF1126139.1 unnamed protein product [Adineta ricciae]